ncbi:PAS domain-containing sensor histidine kinase [Halobacillus litoralis]|uniref:sensor histidine kinase n=1 Tax=Halobacillus litoralis TaxID=45668 RepID=UPI001CD3D32C|nr:PAS domain-containing sensor histidine kinase [Halobacillus litoralis]MCA0970960.1 PAS domain-containing sensor histidine kinase [Halobacillus litoralis]
MSVWPELYRVEFIVSIIVCNILFSALTLYLLHKADKARRYRYGAILSFATGVWVIDVLQARGLFQVSFSSIFTNDFFDSLLSLILVSAFSLLLYYGLRYWERSNMGVNAGAVILSLGFLAVHFSGLLIIRSDVHMYIGYGQALLAFAVCLLFSYGMLRYAKEWKGEFFTYASPFLIDAVAVGAIMSFLQVVGIEAFVYYVESDVPVREVDLWISNTTVLVFLGMLMAVLGLAYYGKHKALGQSRIHKEHYHSLFHSSPNMLCMVNGKGEIVHANIPFLKMMGRQRIALPEKITSLFIEQDEVEECILKSMRGERLRYRTEMKIQDHKLMVIVTHIPISATSMIMHIQDQTELEVARKEVLSKAHLQEQILSAFSEGLFVHDLEGRTIEANSRAAELLGVSFSEVYQVNPFDIGWDFVTERGEPVLNSDIPSVKAIRTGTVQANEILGIRRSKREIQWLSITASPLYLHDEFTGVVVTFSDVTSDITQTLQLEEANTELRKTIATVREENKAKSEVLSRMSHELRTPLNSIIGYSELVVDNYERKEAIGHDEVQKVKKILEAGEHLQQMIGEVLDVSRLEYQQVDIRKEPVDLTETLNGAIDIVTPDAQKQHIGIHMTMGHQPDYILGDRLFLKQVIVNLLDNAIKYNKPYGHVYVTTHCVDDSVAISIKDEGKGIEQSYQNLIFEPFYRIPTTDVHGTGLGLSIVKHALDRMGGNYGVTSSPDEGSTFWISLPLNEKVSQKVGSNA